MSPLSRLIVPLLLAAGSFGAETYFIPAAASAPGAHGTAWKTEAAFLNPGSAPASVRLYFLREGMDNSAAAPHSLSIPAGTTAPIGDLVGAFFASPGAAGGVRVESDTPLVITSRTFNDLGSAGTYGQGVPAFASDQLLTAKEGCAWMPWLVSDAHTRTNIGFLNAGDAPLRLTIEFLHGAGLPIGDIAVDLLPFEFLQFDDPLAGLSAAPVEDAWARIFIETPDGQGLAWASMIDNATGDPIFLPARQWRDFGPSDGPRWARAWGGAVDDVAHAILAGADGALTAAGETQSAGAGSSDVWVAGLGEASVGPAVVLGGPGEDKAFSIRPAGVRKAVLCGATTSITGGWDAWFMQWDLEGRADWTTFLGTSGDEWAYSIYQTADGTFRVCGQIFSDGAVGGDAWALALDAAGGVLWQYRYGGPLEDWTYTIVPTADGGSLLAGGTQSFGSGDWDGWLLKIAADGSPVWQKTYGGSGEDVFYALVPTTDGNFIAAGQTSSWGAGGSDVWVVKVDPEGNVLWQNVVGSPDNDTAFAADATPDGGAVVAGQKGEIGPASGDAWITRWDARGGLLWQTSAGGMAPERLYGAAVGADGRIFGAGRTSSAGQGGKDSLFLALGSDGSSGNACPFVQSTTCDVAPSHAVVREVGSPAAPTTAALLPGAFAAAPFPAPQESLCPEPAPEFHYVVPAAAHIPGAHGTNWRTDLFIRNPNNLAVSLNFQWNEAGGATATSACNVDPLGSASLADVVAATFGRTGAFGSIFISSPAPVIVETRTYDDVGSAGTYGQSIPGTSFDRALGPGEAAMLAGLKRDADFRTNIGFVNLSPEAIVLSWEVISGDGAVLGSAAVTLDGNAPVQINDVLASYAAAEVEAAHILISSDTAWALFAAYASVVDNRTGDPVFIPAVRVP